ncbi:MAG TPA: hypothetical protein VG604_03995 [Candidatus Saccharimonadales bacterium]|nr:hypothetical protein [Candidatus Saccharimonadales bacterium]
MSILPKIMPRTADERAADFKRNILRREAEIGGQLFGEVPKGHQRQFFCLDRATWIWHEEWADQQGQHAITTRYDIRPNGIIKSQDGQKTYQRLSEQEIRNFHRATRMYTERVKAEYQRLLQVAKTA